MEKQLRVNKEQLTYEELLIRDLNLEIILEAMAQKDRFIYEICKKHLLTPLMKEDEISARQQVRKDCKQYPKLFRLVYEYVSEGIEVAKEEEEFIKPKYNQTIRSEKRLMTQSEILEKKVSYFYKVCESLCQLKEVVHSFKMQSLCEELLSKYSNSFFYEVEDLIKIARKIKEGAIIILAGEIGRGGKYTEVELEYIESEKKEVKGPKKYLIGKKAKREKVISLDYSALENQAEEIREAVLIEYIRRFSSLNKEIGYLFEALKSEFAFYVGAFQLEETLREQGICICEPTLKKECDRFIFKELIDPGLSLKKKQKTIGNSFIANNKHLWLITGVNQGGKTTFLRSIGIAQLMAQCGLFVTANQYENKIFTGIFTHFTDSEDEMMIVGLLEQEIRKMKYLISMMKPNSMILMNETFSTTAEKDGAQLAEEVIEALKESSIDVFYVTHLYSYAQKMSLKSEKDILCLRAMRQEDGTRTYHIEEGEPLKTSYATELYYKIVD